MYIWGKGRAAGRVKLFVGNRGSGQNFAESGPKKVTRGQLWVVIILSGLCSHFYTNHFFFKKRVTQINRYNKYSYKLYSVYFVWQDVLDTVEDDTIWKWRG